MTRICKAHLSWAGLLAGGFFAGAALAQDAAVTDLDLYKVIFENDRVRVCWNTGMSLAPRPACTNTRHSWSMP